ncbi:MAG TPA: hypothetical protein VEC16_00730, partial [Alphaproteobacteria bacterium]|nr:hypothetical protein [Alphaproteobacteria bacterium]
MENLGRDENPRAQKEYLTRLLNDASDVFQKKNDFYTLKHIGTCRCVICAKENDKKTMTINIPSSYLKDGILDSSLENGVKGHLDCFKTIDVFFRTHACDGLLCRYCANFEGSVTQGGGIEVEKCNFLKHKYTGNNKLISGQNSCNFFTPGYYMETQDIFSDEREKWNSLQPEFEKRRDIGYKNLVDILSQWRLFASTKKLESS